MTDASPSLLSRFRHWLPWVLVVSGLLFAGNWGWPRWQDQRALNRLVQSGAILDSSHDRPAWVRFHGRQVQPTDLDALLRIDGLRQLFFDGCDISNIPLEPLKQFSSLEILSFNQTGISDAGLVHLQQLPALKELSLDGAYRVTDQGLQTLAKCPCLTDLSIRDTPVTLQGLIQLSAELPELQINSTHGVLGNRKLALSGTRSTDEALIRLSSATSLTGLELPGRITDNGLLHLFPLVELRFLVLSQTRISSKGLAGLLEHLSLLEELNLSECHNLTDKGLRNVAFAASLREIILDDTAAGLETLNTLKQLEHLQLLSLVGCRSVNDAALIKLVGSQESPSPALHSLRFLRLNGTSVTDEGLATSRQLLQKLEGLDLRDTQVTGRYIRKLRAALPRCTILY